MNDEEQVRELMGCEGEIFGEDCGDIGEPCVCYRISCLLTALRTENERLREGLRYVLEDDGLLPRATSKCRDVVRAALKQS